MFLSLFRLGGVQDTPVPVGPLRQGTHVPRVNQGLSFDKSSMAQHIAYTVFVADLPDVGLGPVIGSSCRPAEITKKYARKGLAWAHIHYTLTEEMVDYGFV